MLRVLRGDKFYPWLAVVILAMIFLDIALISSLFGTSLFSNSPIKMLVETLDRSRLAVDLTPSG